MCRRKPLARYGAMDSALRERLAPPEIHIPGHDFAQGWIETTSTSTGQ
jgi:hypothetical protein